MLGTAAWLCLAGMGSSRPISHALSPSAVTQPSCRIQQRTPFYVGFPEGAQLDSFEQSAIASRYIVREVRHWVCGASTSLSGAVSSLQLAFARSAPLQLERLQFDDAELAHAHVVISSPVTATERQHWRVELAHSSEDSWTVTGTGIASASDLADP